MPICEADPWRMQYFKDVACPPGVRIPTEDFDSYEWNPAHHWVYNKLLVAESQGISCAPHGVTPKSFPVFSKPIINLRGMGTGSRVLESLEAYLEHECGGHFWMTLLKGEHISTDVALENGVARWFKHAQGMPSGEGKFDHWIIRAARSVGLERYCRDWLAKNLAGYTGIVNLETIGGRIIEAHLRFTDQWPDLYGKGWLDALVELYAHGRWHFAADETRDGYSVVLFGPHGVEFLHPPEERVEELRREPGITSVQITFHGDRLAAAHAMPPGGFRLAVVNCWDLAAGERVRGKLATLFGLRR
jgi:hypothetical protein